MSLVNGNAVVGMPVALVSSSLGRQYYLMNHSGWFKTRADGTPPLWPNPPEKVGDWTHSARRSQTSEWQAANGFTRLLRLRLHTSDVILSAPELSVQDQNLKYKIRWTLAGLMISTD
uniref:Uncharacterized protein n=1 Tax=Knipowitschia caucasica TaxID=637954 RepID=A0AAV2KPZ4_KNICA